MAKKPRFEDIETKNPKLRKAGPKLRSKISKILADSSVRAKSQAMGSTKSKGKVAEVIKKFANGKLKMGKSGKTVTSPDQALSIGISESKWQNFKDKHHVGSNAQGQSLYKRKHAAKGAALVGGAFAAKEHEEPKKKLKKKKRH